MKIQTLLLFGSILFYSTSVMAQCTGNSTYDLTVTGTTVIHPTGNSFTSAIVCSGATLIDSANCCTRVIHVLPGAVYEAGGNAYGLVFVKSGGTFNANGCTNFFMCTYETGAVILNYTGPLTLCPSLVFSPSVCTTAISEINRPCIHIFTNPDDQKVTIVFSREQQQTAIRVIDVLGKEIQLVTFSGRQWEIEKLNRGVYIIQISDDKAILLNQKIVVQ